MGILTASLGLELLADEPVGDYSADVEPPMREHIVDVTPRTAMTLPAVFRAVQISAGMASELTIDVWRGPTLVTPAPQLVAQPDPWRELSSWIERVVVCMALDGNAFLRKRYAADAGDGTAPRVLALEVLDPHRVRVWRDERGRKRYSYADPIGKRVEDLRGDEVVHLWNLEVPGLDRALGPIGHARASLTGHLDVRNYASGWFKSGDVPSGVLTTDQHLDATAAAEYKKRWKDDEHGVKVLGKGLTYDPMMLSPEDAQWIESQKFGVQDIARLFGVPAAYLLASVEGSNVTYANLEQVDSQFLRTTLFPVYLRKIEAALTSVLPRGQRARFDAANLLRPDTKTRASIHKTYLEAKVMTIPEVRAAEGLPPIAIEKENADA